MFGTVKPLVDELKVREYTEYKSVYCGLCKLLKKRYGFFSRLLLNYDLVIVAMLTDGLLGETGEVNAERCITSPVKKRPILQETKGLNLAADALIILSWHKLKDNISDEKLFKKVVSACCLPLYSRSFKKAAKARPELSDAVLKAMEKQKATEDEKSKLIDKAAEPTGDMLAEIFAQTSQKDDEKENLRKFGRFIGQAIYVIDAAKDINEDLKSGSYNVFNLNKEQDENPLETAKILCNMYASEVTLAYNKLEIKTHKPVLDNIIYIGLLNAINNITTKTEAD